MIDPENITTPIVSAVVAVYSAFWPTSECQCGKAPVCLACEWPWQAGRLQARINASGLSIPIPVIDLSGAAPKIPEGNPLARSTPFFAQLSYDGQLDARSRKVAQSVARVGLPVFYLDNSKAIDLTLNEQGQAVDDIALYAPALVYCHNHDRRGDDISRMLARLYSRASGFCWLIEQKGL